MRTFGFLIAFWLRVVVSECAMPDGSSTTVTANPENGILSHVKKTNRDNSVHVETSRKKEGTDSIPLSFTHTHTIYDSLPPLSLFRQR